MTNEKGRYVSIATDETCGLKPSRDLPMTEWNAQMGSVTKEAE